MDSESTLTIDAFGTKTWMNKRGKLHRLDGPAIECTDSTKYWYQNGLRHRLDGPAIEFPNGGKEWWANGVIHREDGPAFIFSSGRKSWYLNDVRYLTKESYFDALSDEAKAKCLFSEDFLNG
jgi:hypothetical protein